MGLALTEARTGPQRSMDVLSADKEERVDPSIPTPEGSGLAGTVRLTMRGAGGTSLPD
jgi:CHAD domain-containing protein